MAVRNGEIKKKFARFRCLRLDMEASGRPHYCPRLTLRLCKGRVSTSQPAKGSHPVTFYLFSRLQNNRDFNQVKAYRD